MTANQIAYWNLEETKRSNLAKETETNRSNVAKETETNRSNLANEARESSLAKGQLSRWEHQNKTDTAKAVTGGIKDVGSVLFGKGGVAGTAQGLIGAGSTATGMIGF